MRLRKRSDFLRIKEAGRSAHIAPWLLVNFMDNQISETRVGWTLPSYVGSSVLRNRFKRWMREFFHSRNGDLAKLGIDINLVFKRRGKDFYRQLEHKELDSALERFFNQVKSKRR